MKYLPGNIYTNSITSNVGNIVAALLSYPLYKALGLKSSLLACYLVSATAGLAIAIFFVHEKTASNAFVFLLFAIRIGVAASGVYVYTFIN